MTSEEKLVMISIIIIGLFSISAFVYYLINADKLIGFLSVISFTVIIIFAILHDLRKSNEQYRRGVDEINYMIEDKINEVLGDDKT